MRFLAVTKFWTSRRLDGVVTLYAAAPEKPSVGAPCNGCGVCCAAETCPAGRLRFLRRTGPCPALLWSAGDRRYRCGLVSAPGDFFSMLPAALADRLGRLIATRIAAGKGCDSDAEIAP